MRSVRTIRFVIVAAVWLGGMAVFYRKEVLPSLRENEMALAQFQFFSPSLTREEWLGIIYHGQQLGYSHTALYPSQEKGFYGPVLENTVWLELPMLGRKTRLQAYSSAFLTSSGKIRRLKLDLQTRNPFFRLQGKTEGESLMVQMKTERGESNFSLPLPRQALPLHSLSPFIALRPLKKGDSFSLPALDVTRSFTSHTLQSGSIRFEVAEQNENGYHLLAFYEGLTIDIYLNPAGEVVHLITPIGWELKKRSHEEVLNFIRSQYCPVITRIIATGYRNWHL